MAALLKALAKSAGPKLAIGAGLAGIGLLVTGWIDRPRRRRTPPPAPIAKAHLPLPQPLPRTPPESPP
ncbi:hypothetical protein OVY48_22885 [Sphingobium sp. SA2]|uniref:hypothetical protein n=1 Tax=Sphingobium sp. SA2 TaxID=1524832 RepID=UPI0028BF9747|nr:hypothetical protein [Sphingobium sp. SA2]MDT7536245.1 hypothetical protein [Sphingobium sp. SA2]